MAARQTGRTKTLGELGLTVKSGRTLRITGLSVDNRTVASGNLFGAMPGTKVHGARFVPAAIAAGAAAILTDAEGARIARDLAGDLIERHGIAVIVAEDPRQTLAYAAALWSGSRRFR